MLLTTRKIFTGAILFAAGISAIAWQSPASAAAPPKQETAAKQPQHIQTLGEVLAWTYVNNPSLQSARAAFRAAEEALPQALSGWQPTVTADANVTGERISGETTGNGTTSKEVDAIFTQPLYRGGQTVAAVKSARNAIESQRALLRDRVQQVMLAAVTAYMNVVRDQSLLSVAENNVKDLQEQYKASNARFKVGDITKTDVSQAEAALAQAEAGRITALGNLRTSNAVFEQVIGYPPQTLAPPDLRLPIPPTIEEATDFGDRYNPQVVAASYLQQSSKADVDRIFGQQLPRLDLVGDVGREDNPQPGGLPNSNYSSIGITASIPLFTGGLLQSQVRQARHVANERYLDIFDTRRQVRENIVGGWETLDATRAGIESRQAAVKASRLALDGIKQEAAVGTRTVLDELNTEQNWLNDQVSLVTAQRDEVVATFTLGDALGLLTPSTLGFPEIPGYENGGKASPAGHVDKGNPR